MTQPPNPPKPTVLVVHASASVRMRIRGTLEHCCDLTVHEASTGNAAIDLFFRYRPAAVLTEVCLPDSSGFDIIRCFRQAEPDCALILLCQSSDPFVERVGELVGASGVCQEVDAPSCIRDLLRLQQDQAR
jgi:DNA-binding NarL/FixJ family response regulator